MKTVTLSNTQPQKVVREPGRYNVLKLVGDKFQPAHKVVNGVHVIRKGAIIHAYKVA